MQLDDFITVHDFCIGHNISHALVIRLGEHDLIKIVEQKNTLCIPLEELPKAEKILRLHADLDINLEGIGVVTHLLERIEQMQGEMIRLQNRLRLYE